MTSPLERAFDSAAGEPGDFCLVCCGPSARAPLVVLLDGGEELGECEACEGPVEPSGRSIRRPNGGPVKVIYLVDSDEDELDGPPL